jgi:hypothetical protein
MDRTCVLPSDLQSLPCCRGRQHPVSNRLKGFGDDLSDRFFILNDKDGFGSPVWLLEQLGPSA